MKKTIIFLLFISPLLSHAADKDAVASACGCIITQEGQDLYTRTVSCARILEDGTVQKTSGDWEGDAALASKYTNLLEECVTGCKGNPNKEYCAAICYNKKCSEDGVGYNFKEEKKFTSEVKKGNIAGAKFNVLCQCGYENGEYELACSVRYKNKKNKEKIKNINISYQDERACCYGYNKILGDLGKEASPCGK